MLTFPGEDTLVASWQASRAKDPEVARTMRRIARDETRHAALSHAVAAWLEPQLTEADRRRLALARRRAVARLSRDISRAEVSEPLAITAGVPRGPEARRLFEALTGRLAG